MNRRNEHRIPRVSRTLVVAGVFVALVAGTTVAASFWSDPAAPELDAVGQQVGDGLDGVAAGDALATATTVADPLGDSALSVGDLEGAEVGISPSGELTAEVIVAEWTDPDSDDWTFGETGPTWRFDGDGDGTEDHRAEMRVRNGELQSVVFDDESIVCVAEVGSDEPASTYSVAFDVGCIGNPEEVRFRASLDYDDVVFEIEDLDRAPDSGWSAAIENPAYAPPIVTIDPFRLADTREPGAEFDDDDVLRVQVVGRGGVPSDARAVFLNVTAVRGVGPGFITVYPCGFDRPTASNLNFAAGDVRPNAVLAQVGIDGEVCLFARTDVDLVVDVNAYVPARSEVRSVPPNRFLDTREQGGPVVAQSVTEIEVTDRFGVPRDARGVVLNVTAVQPAAPGFLTVFPCGADVPTASNVNYVPGDVVPNAVVAKVGDDGRVCVFSRSATHLVVDVNGYVPSGSTVEAITPDRVLDTRDRGERVPGGTSIEVDVLSAEGVAADAAGVVLNVTALAGEGPGFMTVYPCGTTVPTASNLNYVPGEVNPNAVVAKIGAGGKVCIFVRTAAHVVVDVNGYVP